jgi:hypothetical protein
MDNQVLGIQFGHKCWVCVIFFARVVVMYLGVFFGTWILLMVFYFQLRN